MKDNARQTLALVERSQYTGPTGVSVDFSVEQTAAKAGTRTWSPTELLSLLDGLAEGTGPPPAVVVVAGTTQTIARQLVHNEGLDVILLNFASGRNPGGGFLNGARAQEEDLCRCSGLYPCLVSETSYYTANRQESSTEYTDHAIYSPMVPFFRLKGTAPLLEPHFCASVVTMPAPNVVSRKNPRLPQKTVEAAFARRWRMVLALAAHHGHSTVLLGAWGCGAFGNSPEVVARTAAEAVADPRFHGVLERVVFAIPDSGKVSAANFAVFQRVVGA